MNVLTEKARKDVRMIEREREREREREGGISRDPQVECDGGEKLNVCKMNFFKSGHQDWPANELAHIGGE